jgi:hypothetical protein
MKILFKYTTRSRQHLFERGMRSIIDNVSDDNYEILVTADNDDAAMHNHSFLHHPKAKTIFGHSTGKINAINRDLDTAKDWDILVNMSDDMVFSYKGFDTIIRDNFDNLGQCLHFPDQANTPIIVLSVLGREFYNKFNYIYHPDYISLFCDNEQTDVARLIGAYKYVNHNIFEHLHPALGKAMVDAQYVHTESFYQTDKVTYERRKSTNFGFPQQ